METCSTKSLWDSSFTVDATCFFLNCRKTFTDELSFKQHIKSHGNVSYNRCCYNGNKINCLWKSSSGNFDHFIQHMNTHYGNLSIFKCKFCKYSTASKRNLKRHIKSFHEINVISKKTVKY